MYLSGFDLRIGDFTLEWRYLALFLQELSGDEGGFDKALLKFYMNQVCFSFFVVVDFVFGYFLFFRLTSVFLFFQKVKCLNRKLSSAGRRNVVNPP